MKKYEFIILIIMTLLIIIIPTKVSRFDKQLYLHNVNEYNLTRTIKVNGSNTLFYQSKNSDELNIRAFTIQYEDDENDYFNIKLDENEQYKIIYNKNKNITIESGGEIISEDDFTHLYLKFFSIISADTSYAYIQLIIKYILLMLSGFVLIFHPTFMSLLASIVENKKVFIYFFAKPFGFCLILILFLELFNITSYL